MLLAVEAVPASQPLIAAAVKLAAQSRAEVLVLSVRERDCSVSTFPRGALLPRPALGGLLTRSFASQKNTG